MSDFEISKKPIKVKTKPPSGVVLSIRLSSAEFNALDEAAEKEHRTLSSVARERLLRPDIALPYPQAVTTGDGPLTVVFHSLKGQFVQTAGTPIETVTT